MVRKDGRIPVMSKDLKKQVLAQLEQNRTWGGLASTKEEADKIAKQLNAKGYQTIVTKQGEHVWFVEKSRVDHSKLKYR
jgi:hypothetical protein